MRKFSRNMAKSRRPKNKANDETLIDIVDARDNAQSYFESNKNTVIGVAAVILGLIALGVVYFNFFKAPAEQAAKDAMYKAEEQFARDSFALALENPGGGLGGFLDIIDEYSGTSSANLAKYYAGVCYLNLGKYEVAAEYLEEYSASGSITPTMKNGALGDAYSEIGDFDKALSLYKKASSGDNDLLTPYYLMKLGLLSEKQGDTEQAVTAYNRIKEDFPNSSEGNRIDRYISRLQ